MNLRRLAGRIAAVLAGMGVSVATSSAQAYVEVGGGWNYVAPGRATVTYGNSFNARASVGRRVTPRMSWRIDALVSQFDVADAAPQPCPLVGCQGPGYSFQHENINGLSGNALVSLKPSGSLYVIGGAGLYDVSAQASELHLGVSGGAGLAIPVATRLHAVLEVQWHQLIGFTAGPSWLVPVTVGLRY